MRVSSLSWNQKINTEKLKQKVKGPV